MAGACGGAHALHAAVDALLLGADLVRVRLRVRVEVKVRIKVRVRVRVRVSVSG